MTEEGLFPVGFVVGFRGLKGEVKIRPRTNSPEILLDVTDVIVRLQHTPDRHERIESLRLEKRLLIATFAGLPDRTAVEFMADAEILAPKEQLRDLDADEWWVSDLVGLKAFTTSGAPIGDVISIIDGGNQLLEIASGSPGKSILVPFVKDLVPEVDLRARRVTIRDIPGLLEPQ